MTEEDFKKLFASVATVEETTIITDKESGRSRGFGFVTMANDGAAMEAIAKLNGKDVGGRKLTVNEAREKTSQHSDRNYGGGNRNFQGFDRNRQY